MSKLSLLSVLAIVFSQSVVPSVTPGVPGVPSQVASVPPQAVNTAANVTSSLPINVAPPMDPQNNPKKTIPPGVLTSKANGNLMIVNGDFNGPVCGEMEKNIQKYFPDFEAKDCLGYFKFNGGTIAVSPLGIVEFSWRTTPGRMEGPDFNQYKTFFEANDGHSLEAIFDITNATQVSPTLDKIGLTVTADGDKLTVVPKSIKSSTVNCVYFKSSESTTCTVDGYETKSFKNPPYFVLTYKDAALYGNGDGPILSTFFLAKAASVKGKNFEEAKAIVEQGTSPDNQMPSSARRLTPFIVIIGVILIGV